MFSLIGITRDCTVCTCLHLFSSFRLVKIRIFTRITCLVLHYFSTNSHCRTACSPVPVALLGGVDDVFLAGPVASVQVVVDELGFGVGTAQVFETDLLDVDGGYLLRVVAVYHEAEVGHVGEVGRAVDVVHLDTAPGAVLFVAVHLAGWATRMTRHWLRVAKRPSLFSVSVM